MGKINYAWVQLLLLMLVIGYAVALMCGVSVPAGNKAEFAAVFAVILTLLNVDKLKESISKATQPPDEPAKDAPPDAGFARVPLLILVLAALTLTACATVSGKTDPPQILAGKSLLAIQQTIVNTRQAIGVPCQQGVIPQPACQQMDAWYQQSKPAYDAAVDAEQLALQSTDPTLQTYAQAKAATLTDLAAQLAGLAAQYGIKGGGK